MSISLLHVQILEAQLNKIPNCILRFPHLLRKPPLTLMLTISPELEKSPYAWQIRTIPDITCNFCFIVYDADCKENGNYLAVILRTDFTLHPQVNQNMYLLHPPEHLVPENLL